MDRLTVSEIFGPTLQGEGPSAGKVATFLRLGGCNLTCTWCDTPYSWDFRPGSPYSAATELQKRSIAEVATAIGRPKLLVVTGGEPMLQQAGIVALLDVLPMCDIEIETNGTIPPDPALADSVRFNVSPKLTHAKTEPMVFSSLLAFAELYTATFKWVVQTADDVGDVVTLAADLGVPLGRVMVMPEGRTSEEWHARLPEIAEAAVLHGVRVSPRLHLDIWGTKRGH